MFVQKENQTSNDEYQPHPMQELEKIINALTHRAPDDEYESLKKRLNERDPSLRDEDKQRYRELLKQRKQ